MCVVSQFEGMGVDFYGRGFWWFRVMSFRKWRLRNSPGMRREGIGRVSCTQDPKLRIIFKQLVATTQWLVFCGHNTHIDMAKPLFISLTALLARPRPALPRTLRHAFHSSTAVFSKQLPPRRIIPESEIIENFLKGSGPGGQKINKTSSAVQLKHIPTGIVVKYQDTRSRAQNRKIARKLLQDRLEEFELGDEARTRVKAREKSKKKASSDKKKRRKYRALEATKEGEEGGEEVAELDGDVEGEIGEAGKGMETDDTCEGVNKQGRRERADKAG